MDYNLGPCIFEIPEKTDLIIDNWPLSCCESWTPILWHLPHSNPWPASIQKRFCFNGILVQFFNNRSLGFRVWNQYLQNQKNLPYIKQYGILYERNTQWEDILRNFAYFVILNPCKNAQTIVLLLYPLKTSMFSDGI